MSHQIPPDLNGPTLDASPRIALVLFSVAEEVQQWAQSGRYER
jgi:hypothetical protein